MLVVRTLPWSLLFDWIVWIFAFVWFGLILRVIVFVWLLVCLLILIFVFSDLHCIRRLC